MKSSILKMVPYSAIIGWGKNWQKVYLKGLVRKYLVNAIVNILYVLIYLIIIVFNAPKRLSARNHV